VFWKLINSDAEFRMALRRYAAALDLSSSSSGQDKTTYETKAGEFLTTMVKWLQQHITTAYEVTCQGVSRNVAEWIKHGQISVSFSSNRLNVRDLVNLVSSVCLVPCFQNDAPEYPVFTLTITNKSRPQAAQDAIRWIGGVTKTQQAAAVLDALELFDG